MLACTIKVQWLFIIEHYMIIQYVYDYSVNNHLIMKKTKNEWSGEMTTQWHGGCRSNTD